MQRKKYVLRACHRGVQCRFPFFFNQPAPTELYPLSLHDALPISATWPPFCRVLPTCPSIAWLPLPPRRGRSEEHTSELQSHSDLVCRLLLEKKKTRLG